MGVRILHTADWHVGRTIARRSRIDEHRAVLAGIVEAAADHRPDVVVVAGDVFEQQNPSAEAERVAFTALADLGRVAGRVVVVAGNHDSPRRWQALTPLAQAAGIHVIADVRADPERHVVDVEGADGSRARLVCLPWVPEHRFLRGDIMLGLQNDAETAYAAQMGRLVGAMLDRTRGDGRPQVLVAHLFVSDSLLGGGERSLTVGETYAVAGQAIPARVRYAALGHVHRLQQAPGSGAAWYCGSPLALDFSEHADDKAVLLAEVGEGLPTVRPVPVTGGRRLHRVSGTLAEIEHLAATGEAPRGWLEVTVRAEGPHPGVGDRVRELLPDCVAVRLDYPRQERRRSRASLKGLSPREMFARYLAEREGLAAPDPALLERFERLLDDTGPREAGAEEAA